MSQITNGDELLKAGWKKYPAGQAYPHAECFYQKRFFLGEHEGYAQVVQYAPIPPHKENTSWELDIYIDDKHSIVEMALQIKSYSYTELDIDLIELHARTLIKPLLKNL